MDYLVWWHINPCGLFNAKPCLYKYILDVIFNALLELIYLYTVQWFQVFLSNINSSICKHLDGLM